MQLANAENGHATRAMSAKPVVVCQRLTKVFRDFWMRSRARAVDSINFHIEPGEIFGLLGPNGSGKSTTIKIMLGLLRPTSGRVAVFGKPPSDVLIKKRIGYLPEESYLYQFLNARETLDYYARLFEIDHRTRTKRVGELLDMVGLSGAQFRPVREYSKGMQRRIGLAQALVNDPDFLVLDEPTTGLDPIGTKQVKDLILELGRRGKTVLLSSHLLSDVEDVVDRMVILYGGRIRAAGTCDELLVAQNRTTIETDALDEQTISRIDALVRSRSGGESAVIRVSHPRQRLEDLFLDIVERARAERLETSGATSGGTTASFLSADALSVEGDALIDTLMTAQTRVPDLEEHVEQSEEQAGEVVRASLIDDLVAPTSSLAPGADVDDESATDAAGLTGLTRASAEPAAGPNVDRSVIDSLLGGSSDEGSSRDAEDRR